MTDIGKLLNKQYKNVGADATAIEKTHPAEKHTSEYNTKIKRDKTKGLYITNATHGLRYKPNELFKT